ASWYAALEVDNAHLPAYTELERLLAAASRWHDLVELLERLAELHATLGDGHAEIQALARAADVWEAKLDSPDAAGEILENMLQRRVASVQVPAERVALLVEIAELERKAGRNDAALAALARAASDSPTDVRVLGPLADLYFAAGRLDEAAPIYDKLAGEAKTA